MADSPFATENARACDGDAGFRSGQVLDVLELALLEGGCVSGLARDAALADAEDVEPLALVLRRAVLARGELAEAAAIMNINPLLITLGAAIFLGESIGARRAAGIVAAMIGALLVIRPGGDLFQPAALLTVGAAIAYSGYNLATRFVRDDDPWTSLFYTAAFGAIVLSCTVPFFWVRPDATALMLMALIAFFGTTSQLCLIKALSLGEAGMLAPYAYTGLIWAALWGVVFFGDWPDFWTILGGGIIVAAGLYVWYRETFQKRHPH